ncbi:MAG: hypothetical protein OQK76_12175 [Gammaproteobacteria bacterium]|nr:hypothetical protein [Gammaproteobacteria bacterium]MCW8911363.1 hypothetical protein [Gammaproteobacteria bacterium]MCW9005144.1 hypothetical protein [Gammaproteobacteria bacterium]MCW9056462.1 hypothetical protein [Gammaproteobacteria bacterium]
MKGITVDSDSKVVEIRYAVVYAPKRSRGRFSENCVFLLDSEVAALEEHDPDKKLYAAKVIGPSKSSEGQRIYYLDDWL